MKLKNKIGIFVLVCMVIGVALLAFSQKESQKEEEKEQTESHRVQSVLDSLWEDYDLYSMETTQYDTGPPITSINYWKDMVVDP